MKKYFKTQIEHQRRLYDFDNFSEEDKIKLTKDFILSGHKEFSEVLDCIKWKSHRKEDDKRFTLSNLEEELIDVFKYLINICVVWGITPEEFDRVFDAKTEVVLQRFRQEFIKPKKDEKVCAIDLDGVLNEWEQFFIKTFNEANNTKYLSDAEIRKHTNPLDYADFKHWWRDSGIKLNIPVKKHAAEFTRFLKKKKYRIIIISSRPYKKYSRIFPDTMDWLKKYHISYDDVYFEEDKHLKILRHFPRLKFMIEDNERFASQVARAGYRVFLFNQNPTEEIQKNKSVVCVKSLKEIEQYIR